MKCFVTGFQKSCRLQEKDQLCCCQLSCVQNDYGQVSPKLLSLAFVVTSTSLPADNSDRYLVFISTTAHWHLVFDYIFLSPSSSFSKSSKKKYPQRKGITREISPGSPGPHQEPRRKGTGLAPQECCLKACVGKMRVADNNISEKNQRNPKYQHF